MARLHPTPRWGWGLMRPENEAHSSPCGLSGTGLRGNEAASSACPGGRGGGADGVAVPGPRVRPCPPPLLLPHLGLVTMTGHLNEQGVRWWPGINR